MSRGKQLFKNTIILSVGTFLPKLAQIIVLPIYTSMLTKSEYGTYDLINILVSVLVPIITLQLQQAAFRFLIEMKDKKSIGSIVSNIYIFIIPISIICTSGLIIILNDITIIGRILIAMYLFIEIMTTTTRQVARGLSNNKGYSISSIVNSIFNVIFAILLLSIFNLGLSGLLLSLIISLSISLIYLVINSHILSFIKISLFDKRILKNLLEYSLPMIPNSISLWVVNLSDRLLIGKFMGVEANAIYAVSNKIPSVFGLAYNTFNMAWQESASIASEDSDVSDYYSITFEGLFNFLVGAMAILIACTPILFKVLIKGEYNESYYQMPILFLGVFFSSLSSFYGGIYVAFKESKKIGVSSTLSALLNFIINLLLIREIGIYAASISTLISYFTLVVYRLKDIKRICNIRYKTRKNIICILILILMSVLCYQRNAIINKANILIGVFFAVAINKKIIVNVNKIISLRFKK